MQHIQASYSAFGAILIDGSVVTWGEPAEGGDSSSVQGQLKKVQEIQTSLLGFVAIIDDGSLVTWGHEGLEEEEEDEEEEEEEDAEEERRMRRKSNRTRPLYIDGRARL